MTKQAEGGQAQRRYPPGWYPDPSGGSRLRWYDGDRWTDAQSGLGTRRRAHQQNATGWGARVVGAGLAVQVCSWGLPWYGDVSLLTVSGDGADELGPVMLFAVLPMLWTFLSIRFACTRYQPGFWAGWFYAGPVGMIVCREPIGADSPSRRSNWLAFFVLGGWTALWAASLDRPPETTPYPTAIGVGATLFGAGMALAMVGVLIGRRRVLVPATSIT